MPLDRVAGWCRVQPMRLCWADKIGLTLAFLAYAGLFLISNDKGAALAFFFSGAGLRFLALCLSPWLVLRAIDFVAGGPQRRRGWIKVRAIRD